MRNRCRNAVKPLNLMDFNRLLQFAGVSWISTLDYLKAYDFARLAFGDDLEGAAADFAISCEALAVNARIHGQFK